MKKTISLRVNGSERSVEVEARTTLLDLVREQFGLTGTWKKAPDPFLVSSHPKIGDRDGETRKKRRGKNLSVLGFDD